MRKKLLSMLAVAAGLLMATSCSNEREEVQTEGEAVVSFVAELPHSLVNRAPQSLADATTFGDGTTATNLQYHVYKVGTDDSWTPIADLAGTATFVNLKATVSLKLVNGNKYAVAFWADAPSTIYTFDEANCSVSADYTNVKSSNESLDAFYAVKELEVTGTTQETIELRRPFAQLNIGTADLEESKKAGQEIAEAGITVKTYNTLSLKDGAVSGEAEVTFAEAALPTENFPVVGGYSYLAMNYLLMPADKKADNTVTISYDDASGVQDRVFYNVPLQRNYRTNIYGNLLTSTTEFNIIIKPEFNDPDNDIEVWNGTTKTEPQESEGAYIVTKAAEWAWLTGKNITKNITLTNDIDFGGFTITPICLNGGVFEGNNHILSNVNLVAPAADNYSVGLFYGTYMPNGATIQNLTVKDAKVTSSKPDMGWAAVVLGDAQGDATIENVHVINGEVNGVKAVAGLVGFSAGGNTLNITNCSVKETTIKNLSVEDESGFVASLVGRVVGIANLTNCVLENNTIDAFYAADRGEASIDAVAGVNSGATLNTTNVTGAATVTVTKKLVE